MIIVQKADLAGSSFTNNNTNAAGGIKVNTAPGSDVAQAIAAAVAAIPAEKFVTSGAYTAATDTLTLTFTDSSTVNIPFGAVILDAVASIPVATDTVAGISSLAVAANYPSASDTESATPAYVAAAMSGRTFTDTLTNLNNGALAAITDVLRITGATTDYPAVLTLGSYSTPSAEGTPHWHVATIDGVGGGSAAVGNMTPSGLYRQATARALHVGPEVNSWLIYHAGAPTQMMVGTATYDGNGALIGFNVQWPDGGTGVYTATVLNGADPSLVDGYTVTYVGPTAYNGTTMATPWQGISKVVTQPPVTRNASGAVTNRPLRTVA